MTYYEGQTLFDDLAANGGRLPEEEAVEIIQDILDGLGPVHEAGVLHRDIDPQNIYLVDEGALSTDEAGKRAILIDFGAAREAIGQKSQSLNVILKPPEATERIDRDALVAPRGIREEISMETSLAVKKGRAVALKRRPASAREFAELLGRTRTANNRTRVSTGENLQTQRPEAKSGKPQRSAGTSSHPRSGSDLGTEVKASPTGTKNL